ncbi:MAG: phytanoyl-CoA dioxygenase family protein [Candidatus Poribacteria bacterium]|nr:phytanoyl-CoA dioxygenase family protein [Candidatus Poribacteria bacterium]
MDAACLEHCLTDNDHQAFEKNGFLPIPGALPTDMIDELNAAMDRIIVKRGEACSKNELTISDILAAHDIFLELIDWPRTFPKVWKILKWNIHVCHTELRVTPPEAKVSSREKRRLRWSQEGGRLNRELLEATPPPRISVTVGFFLTDLTASGCGNPYVLPESHLEGSIQAPFASDSNLDGATELRIPAGTAVIFDRRLWRAHGQNLSGITQKAVSIGYSYRWFHPTVDMSVAHLMERSDPIRRQLLGATTSNLALTTPTDADVPLRDLIQEHLGDEAIADRSVRNLT